MSETISEQQAADRAALRMEAAIQRHTGWQLEYDFTMVVNDRKRLIDELAAARARVAELEGEREQAVNAAEKELTDRIVARIMRIADAQTDPDIRVKMFRNGLLVAASEAKVEYLYDPDTRKPPAMAAAPDRAEGSQPRP